MTMPMNVKDYVKIYDVLDKKECKKIVTSLNKIDDWKNHSYYDVNKNVSQTFDDDFKICYALKDETKMLMDKLWHIVNMYIRFDLSFCQPWYDNWSGYSQIRWNRYDTGTRMQVHCDHIQSMFDGTHKGIPTLSLLGALNDNYKGGELVLWETDVIELKAGQVIIFPSNFMYPHKVNTITKGTRYSFVSWVW
jgi:hypothetical protein